MGIENTFINHPHPITGKRLDEYELINHYQKWNEDLSLLKTLPISALRWGIPWYKANPEPGKFDFSWSERVIDRMLELGIEPILDLVHYGTPDWMDESFLHPDYPQRVAEFTQAVLNTFSDRIVKITPNNEPYTAAEFCGLRGEWPPYGDEDRVFLRIMNQIGRGVMKTCALLQEYNKEAVHVEVASYAVSEQPELQGMVTQFNARQRLYWDMITGRINDDHILFSWLKDNGWDDADFQWFENADTPIDIMGLNFYPQWSVSRFVNQEKTGSTEIIREALGVDALCMQKLLKEYWDVYAYPIMLTETSVYGSALDKAEWLRTSTDALFTLKDSEVSIVGYTWFPAIDMVNWDYKIHEGGRDAFLIHLGLFDIQRRPYTSALDAYHEVVGEHV